MTVPSQPQLGPIRRPGEDSFAHVPAGAALPSEETLRKKFFEALSRLGQPDWNNPDWTALESKLEPAEADLTNGFVIGSARTRALYWQVEHELDRNVKTFLVLGERGAGKEVLAEFIAKREFKGKPITINCSVLRPDNAEAELFGIDKDGGYLPRGTKHDKPGFFDVADGGVAFLDEFFEIPPEVQPKLLRVLAERTYNRLGGTALKRVAKETVIVAASNVHPTRADLDAAQQRGDVRADLIDRFDSTLLMPPLRERRNEIPYIAQHVLKKYCKALGLEEDDVTIDEEALELLRTGGEWPGNVRKLRAFLEQQARAALAANRKSVEVNERVLRSFARGPELVRPASRPGASALWAWDAGQIKAVRREQLIAYLASLARESRSDPDPCWVIRQVKDRFGTANASQHLVRSIGIGARELAKLVRTAAGL